MTGEVERYQLPPETPGAELAPATGQDSWIRALQPIVYLAQRVADTDFVPEALRGSPAAVAAAILTGREIGIGPMAALRHVYIVKGKPGMSAELARQKVLEAGHQLRYVETTDSRCVVEGRRRGDEGSWTRVQFTADQAKRAGIDLGKYPEDKLVARATIRLCRRLFADAIGGMPATFEEIEDGVEPVGDAAVKPSEAVERPAEPARRTAQRQPRKTAAKPPSAAVERPSEPVQVDEPPLPEDTPDAPVEAENAGTSLSSREGDGGVPDPNRPVTKDQLTRLHTLFGELGWLERADKLRAAQTIIGRNLESSTELTVREASALMDTLDSCRNTDDPQGSLLALLVELEAQHKQTAPAEAAADKPKET